MQLTAKIGDRVVLDTLLNGTVIETGDTFVADSSNTAIATVAPMGPFATIGLDAIINVPVTIVGAGSTVISVTATKKKSGESHTDAATLLVQEVAPGSWSVSVTLRLV